MSIHRLSQDYDLASYASYVVCRLQKNDFEITFYDNIIFSFGFCQKSAESKSQK